MNQTWPTEGTKHAAMWYAHSRRSPCLPWYRAPCQLWKTFPASMESQWTLWLRYFTTASQQMSAAIQRAVDDILSFSRTCFVCLSAKQQTTLKWKNDVISLFPVLQGSAETLIRWGGKLCHLSTAWMLSMKHSCQKLLKDKTYTWVRLKNVGDLFMRHSVVIPLLQWLRGESSDKDVLITESKTLKQHRAYDSAVGSVILTDSKCKLKIILMSTSRR